MLSSRICGVNKKGEIFIIHDGKSDKKRDKNKQTTQTRFKQEINC